MLCFVVYIDISLFKNLGRMLFSYLLCLYFFHVPGFVHLIFLLMFFSYTTCTCILYDCSDLAHSSTLEMKMYKILERPITFTIFCKSNNFSNPSFYYYLFSVISGQCIFKCILLLCTLYQSEKWLIF